MEPIDGGTDQWPPGEGQQVTKLIGKHRLPSPVDTIDSYAHGPSRGKFQHRLGHALEDGYSR